MILGRPDLIMDAMDEFIKYTHAEGFSNQSGLAAEWVQARIASRPEYQTG
jgi:hypothetical protein